MPATDPTINGLTLSVAGTHTQRNPPPPRVTVSEMPSVDGAFTQRFGHGPRNITGRGVLRAASYLLMKSAVETIAEGTNHAPTDYVDADGSSHANCILMQYERVGEIHIEDDTSWWCDVRWVVFQQVSA